LLSGVLIVAMAGSAVAQPAWPPQSPPGDGGPSDPPPLYLPQNPTSAGQPIRGGVYVPGQPSGNMGHMSTSNLKMNMPGLDEAGDKAGDLASALEDAQSKEEKIIDMLKEREENVKKESRKLIKDLRNMLKNLSVASITGFLTGKLMGWVTKKIDHLIKNNPITDKINEINDKIASVGDKINDIKDQVNDVGDKINDAKDTAGDIADDVKNNWPPGSPPPQDDPPGG